MCLLIHKPKDVIFTRADIKDYYQYNPDGFGVMWSELGSLRVVKVVGSFKEVWKAYQNYAAGKECAMHFRMKTHGDIDKVNCHPYPVCKGLGLMHNGILEIGNAADKTKSDTWHYIDRYLRPMFEKHGHELLDEVWFKDLVESHIGRSNKFLLMAEDGKVVILNEKQGLWHKLTEDQPAAWFSNTYAWSAPNKYPTVVRSGGRVDFREYFDTDYDYSRAMTYTYPTYNRTLTSSKEAYDYASRLRDATKEHGISLYDVQDWELRDMYDMDKDSAEEILDRVSWGLMTREDVLFEIHSVVNYDA